MAYTTSARFERQTATGAADRTPHEGRTAEHPGDAHTNKNIDAERTRFNKTWVGDGRGGISRTNDPKDWTRRVRANVAERARGPVIKDKDGQPKLDADGRPRRKALRKDASVVVDAVFQLDPDFTGTSEELLRPENAERKVEVERLLMRMVTTHADRVGRENVAGFSIQWDETHPHVHMQVTPITPDGRLDWKHFVNGPKALGAYHDVFRRDLQKRGYDATMERVGGGRKADTLTQFRRNKDAEKKMKAEAAQVLADAKAQAEQVVAGAQEQAEQIITNAQLDASGIVHDAEKKAATLTSEATGANQRAQAREQSARAREKELDAREAAVRQGEADILRRRAAAVEEGKAEGLAAGQAEVAGQLAEARAKNDAAAQALVNAQALVTQRQRELDGAKKKNAAAAQALERAQALEKQRQRELDAIKTDPPEPGEQWVLRQMADNPSGVEWLRKKGVAARRSVEVVTDEHGQPTLKIGPSPLELANQGSARQQQRPTRSRGYDGPSL